MATSNSSSDKGADNNNIDQSPVEKPEQVGLSTISKMYDTTNKGYLDDNEQRMRELDKSNRGHLTNAQVYDMMTEMNTKMVTMRKLIIGLCIFAVLLSLANVGTAFAAARLAKDTAVDSNSAALMTKDGSETVGTKTLAGMQVSLSNGCVDVEQLAKAYHTIQSGSVVSMVSTTSAPDSSKKTGEDSDTGDGFVTLTEQSETISKASMVGNDICLGSTCFALGTPCGGVNNDEGDANNRRLELTGLHRDTFLQVMQGKSSNGSLRNKSSRRLEDACCASSRSKCKGSCTSCSDCVSIWCAAANCQGDQTCVVQNNVAYCAGGACGDNTCSSSEYCCDPSCSKCTTLGGFCTLGC